MHYKEKLIDGAWHYRVSPSGSWIKMDYEMLSAKYTVLKYQTFK